MSVTATKLKPITPGEKPILFSGPMVRAILAGTKTVTRRIVKPQPALPDTLTKITNLPSGFIDYAGRAIRCPYGVGQRLWVRETWVELLHTSPASDEPFLCEGDKLIEPATRRPDGGWNYDGRVIAYRATSDVEFCDGDGFSGDSADKSDMPRWRSPIHMPRWASRLTLEIVSVRVERLQEITEADARAEGCGIYPIAKFAELWDEINRKRAPWESNPWVWRIEFKRLEVPR